MRDFQSSLLIVGALLVSVGIGWLSTHYGLPLAVFCALLIAVFIVSKVRDLWLVIFTVGIHFDDQYINFGFLKAGYGDFALIVLIAYWALWRYNRRAPIQLPHKWPLLILYVIGVGLSWQQGPAPRAVTGLFIRNTLYVFGFLALVDLLRVSRQLKTFIWTTLIVTTMHVTIALFLLERSTRLEGLSGQPNVFGGLIGPGALIAIILSSSRLLLTKWRIPLALIGLLITIGLILTVSRGSQIAFLLALLWVYRRRWRGIMIVAVCLIIMIQVIYLIEPSRLDYFFNRWEFKEGSVSGRREILFNALNTIVERPIFGVGFAQFMQLDSVMSLDSGHGRASHNHYIGELATIGIPTALALFMFILYQGRRLWQLTDLKGEKTQIYITILQALFIFQSIALIFRGGRRMIEWAFLAVYTASVIIYYGYMPYWYWWRL